MRYEAMGRNRTQRLNIPQLLGGLNTATDPTLIEDDELSAVCNLTFDHGALVTREAVRAVGDEAVVTFSEQHALHVNTLLRSPVYIEEKPCAVLMAGVDVQKLAIKVMSLDGNFEKLYREPSTDEKVNINAGAALVPADKEAHGAYFLMYNNKKVYSPDDESGEMKRVEEDRLYAPFVMINGTSIPIGDVETDGAGATVANGVMYEGFNLLTDRYRAQFTPSVESGIDCYCLPTRLKASSKLVFHAVTTKGEADVEVTVGAIDTATEFRKMTIGGTEYMVGAYPTGLVRVKPALPCADAAGTVTVTCERESTDNAKDLSRVDDAIWFGGTANKRGGTRLFLVNHRKSKLMWSDVNNPFYFPENNYMYVGDLSQPITALEKQGDMLVIFKEREIYYTTYVQGEIDTEAGMEVTAMSAYFPLTQLSPSIGCRCPNSIALCRDRLVWMDSDARVYTLVVSGQYSERNVREIGQKVRPFLLANTTESERRSASAIDHKGKYRLMIGARMAEFDYNDSGFVNVSGYASGERAARNIAWMTHRFGFPSESTPMLMSDGADKALLVLKNTTYVRTEGGADLFDRQWTVHVFDETQTVDRYLVSGKESFQDITVSLTTKTYEFGDPVAYKRIDAFFPMMQAENAELFFIVDGVTPPYGKPYRSADTFAHLVLPCVHRCRTFGLRMDATGKVCIKGMRMQYTMFGTVK